jgi:pimeloyl-ACP methyl ester carboxylesterase
MAKSKLKSPADYIATLDINGLEGRMLHMPAFTSRKREILLIYGHHAMLERWWGLAQNLNEYGNVTMPDLPGFGGMDSFSKIGKFPSVDNYADYLAAFIKMKYRKKKVTIVAISFGFVIATRMLQRYPELTKKVDMLVSIVGFVHKDDFLFTPRNQKLFRGIARVFATRPVAFLIRYCFLNNFILTTLYSRMPNSKRRMIEVPPEEFRLTMDFEVQIWQANDVRTHWMTTYEFLNLDNCAKQVNLPIFHVISKQDHYFNNDLVKQHMLVVFTSYRRFIADSKAHTPSILADKKASGVLLPQGLKKILAKD